MWPKFNSGVAVTAPSLPRLILGQFVECCLGEAQQVCSVALAEQDLGVACAARKRVVASKFKANIAGKRHLGRGTKRPPLAHVVHCVHNAICDEAANDCATSLLNSEVDRRGRSGSSSVKTQNDACIGRRAQIAAAFAK